MSATENATTPTAATIGDLIRQYGQACLFDETPLGKVIAKDLDYLSRLDASDLTTVGDLHVVCDVLDMCPGGDAHWGSHCDEHGTRGEVAR